MCKEAKILLLISALFTFAMGLSGIFINVFFWRETGKFTIIVIYNLIHYIITPIAFIAAGIIAKKRNGTWALRIGLFLYALFYAVIIISGNKGVSYIYALGILYGTATGFYWLAFNTLCFDFTCMENRDTFNGFNGSCAGVTAAIAPVSAGFIISRFSTFKGYNIIFTITLSVFVVLVLISIMLKCKNCGNKINFNKVLSRNCEEWRDVRISTFLWGFRDVIMAFVVNILIIQTTRSELSLGKLTLIASLLGSLSCVLVQKIIKPSRRRLSILIGTIGSFVAVLIIVYKVLPVTLLAYIALDAVFLPFFTIQLSSSTFNVINRAHEEDLRIEYMINKDIAINGGRVVSASILLLLLSSIKYSWILKVYLVFIGLAPIAAGYFLRKLRGVLEGK